MRQYTLKNLKCSVLNEISAQIEFIPDSFWFLGHFPGDPILPGIAQLGMVLDALEQSNDQKLKVVGVSRVRFKRIVRPGDRLSIGITPVAEKHGSYSFRLSVDTDPACSGIMTVDKVVRNGSS